jgi:cytochrome oxidase Cu insertion factor (SCO1/SenC/PrrC family)
LPSRKRRASFAAIGLVAVIATALGAGWSRAQAAEETAAPEAVAKVPEAAVDKGANPFADRFPNLVLKTHEGKNVRFYDDLLKGKIVLINFFYVTCKER